MPTDTDLIRAEPHVEIGSLIARDADVLVQRWCDRAIEEQPKAARVHANVLRDDLGPFLKAMGMGLAQAGETQPVRVLSHAAEHGEQRWDSGWSISEVVRDYQILQLVILEHLESGLERPLRYREIMAVGVFIDDAVAMSIAAYVGHRDAETRRVDQERAIRLEEANRRKDDLIALVVHELRNPLAPIVNATRALGILLTTDNEPVRESLRVIRRQTRQLARLLDDLSDLTRIRQGRLELRRDIIDVSEAIEQAIQTCRPLYDQRSHCLTVHLEAPPLAVDADAARLVQVLVNLLNNAAKYTPPGGDVTVSACQAGDVVEIRVRDSGVGIRSDMLERVFDLYTRAEEAEAQSPDGLGIGLALVKELVALHNGTVRCVSSGRGQGAEFIVTLPIARNGHVKATTPPTPMNVGSCTLLVIEDDEDSRATLATLLGLMGHEVETAPNGTIGMQQALSRSFDAILVDIGLPDRSGYDVARFLRGELHERSLLVALTGYGRQEDINRALEAGFDAHLVKPLDMDALGFLLASRERRAPDA
jgi:signal transduction histidine kinase/ActR/RegA family two-component response regulator